MNWLRELREVVPSRRLTFFEAKLIAERQANALRRKLAIDEPAMPTPALTSLPYLMVGERAMRDGQAGGTKWLEHRWVIVLNRNEPATRRRFSLCHELKHIVDHPVVEQVYGHRAAQRNRSTESICDYFAACLLMPKLWVKRLYFSGVQDVDDLADMFDVSSQAMEFRLRQLGLVETYGRHGEMHNSNSLTYLRSAPASSLGLAA